MSGLCVDMCHPGVRFGPLRCLAPVGTQSCSSMPHLLDIHGRRLDKVSLTRVVAPRLYRNREALSEFVCGVVAIQWCCSGCVGVFSSMEMICQVLFLK
jgi:hypothetical protein